MRSPLPNPTNPTIPPFSRPTIQTSSARNAQNNIYDNRERSPFLRIRENLTRADSNNELIRFENGNQYLSSTRNENNTGTTSNRLPLRNQALDRDEPIARRIQNDLDQEYQYNLENNSIRNARTTHPTGSLIEFLYGTNRSTYDELAAIREPILNQGDRSTHAEGTAKRNEVPDSIQDQLFNDIARDTSRNNVTATRQPNGQMYYRNRVDPVLQLSGSYSILSGDPSLVISFVI